MATLARRPVGGTNLANWFGQYIWSFDEPVSAVGWNCQKVGQGHLAYHPELPVTPVRIDGRPSGALIGWPVLDGAFPTSIESNSFDDFKETLENFGGRWLYIGNDRVITDPFASQPCVYREQTGELASSVNLLSNVADQDDELVSLIAAADNDFFYPFGLTNRRGVRRLLANQELLLPSFSTRRWNKLPTFTGTLQEAAREISSVAALTTEPFHKKFGIVIPLTAGFDSRMLLACLRTYVGEAVLLTNVSHTRTSEIDVDLARAVAKRLNLPHTLHPKQESDAAIAAWDEQTGRPTGGGVRKGNMLEPPFGDRSYLSGFGGEHAKAYYVRPDDSGKRGLSLSDSLTLLRVPRHPLIEAVAEQWLAELPSADLALQKEYLYIEQKTGSWGAPQVLMPQRSAPRMFSFNHRRIIGAMLSASIEDRRAVNVHREVIRQSWPELLNWPFNDFVGWKAKREFVTKNIRYYTKRFRA